MDHTKWISAVIGLVCLATLIYLNRRNRKIPAALIVTVISTVVSYLVSPIVLYRV